MPPASMISKPTFFVFTQATSMTCSTSVCSRCLRTFSRQEPRHVYFNSSFDQKRASIASPGKWIQAFCTTSSFKSTSHNATFEQSTTASLPPQSSGYAHLTASYNSTPPPTTAQLNYATNFFTKSQPKYLLSYAKFRQLPVSQIPEVCFLGRSNVGKSSLLNALVHRTGVHIANVSKRPGRTRTMNAFGIGNVQVVGRAVKTRKPRSQESTSSLSQSPAEQQFERWISTGGGLVVLDMPGYGQASREEWGKEIVKYLSGRTQLRRTFLLVDAEHGPKESDLHMLRILREEGIPHQIVLSKIDKLIVPSKRTTASTVLRRIDEKLPSLFTSLRQDVIRPSQMKQREGIPTLDDLITTSSDVALPLGSSRKIGIDNLRWAVLAATGLECDEMGNRRLLDFDIQAEIMGNENPLPTNKDKRVKDTHLHEDPETVVSWEAIEQRLRKERA